jgi:hypothetical protein
MTAPTLPAKKPLISNRVYDVLKYIAIVFLPATGALYFGLSGIWGLPYGEQVVGTVALVGTFLGAVLLLSSRSYNNSDAKYDGKLVVDTTGEDVDIYRFETENLTALEGLRDKKELILKVDNTSQ